MSFDLGLILSIVAGLVGLPMIWSVIIDILKKFGVVSDGTSGKWNAAFNLITLVVVAVIVGFFPNLDIATIDNKLLEIGKFAGLIVGYLFQIFLTNTTHKIAPVYNFTKG